MISKRHHSIGFFLGWISTPILNILTKLGPILGPTQAVARWGLVYWVTPTFKWWFWFAVLIAQWTSLRLRMAKSSNCHTGHMISKGNFVMCLHWLAETCWPYLQLEILWSRPEKRQVHETVEPNWWAQGSCLMTDPQQAQYYLKVPAQWIYCNDWQFPHPCYHHGPHSLYHS